MSVPGWVILSWADIVGGVGLVAYMIWFLIEAEIDEKRYREK